MNRFNTIALVALLGIMMTGIYFAALYSFSGTDTQQSALSSTSTHSPSSVSLTITASSESQSQQLATTVTVTQTSPLSTSYYSNCPCAGRVSQYNTTITESSVSTYWSMPMMGGDVNWTWMHYPTATVNISQAIALMQNPPGGVSVFRGNNTVVLSRNITSVLILGMMPDDAQNLTGMQPPTYAKDDVFVIYGLIDPTVVIPRGITIQYVFVNLDDDMYHNFVLTTIAPPYSYMMGMGMMGGYGGMMGGGGSGSGYFLSMMSTLPPADYGSGIAHAYSYSLTLSSDASLWYVCTYPSHAQEGMYGRVLVAG